VSHVGKPPAPPPPSTLELEQNRLKLLLLDQHLRLLAKHPDTATEPDFNEFPGNECPSPQVHDMDLSTDWEVTPELEVEETWNPDYELADGDLEPDLLEDDLHYGNTILPLVQPVSNSDRFRRHIIDGNVLLAASVLVAQAAFQNPMNGSGILPVTNIMLFLYLAKLVMSATGELQQHNIAKVLSILQPYANLVETGWSPIPCTVSGFRSTILNVSNTNSLVSILPIPAPETLPDGHGYTPFRSILSHALMMKTFNAEETKDPKWQSLASCDKFRSFLSSIPQPHEPLGLLQIAVGIIIWTDGWDTCTGMKSNRSPMHTGSVTLLFVNVGTGMVIGIATYPNMGGPGKIDHGSVFRRFQEDLAEFESCDNTNRVFPSRHHSCDVEVHTQMLFVVQDQPERRSASGLLGGGSTLHPLFGMSCDFNQLQLPFEACLECQTEVLEYIAFKDWSPPPGKPLVKTACPGIPIIL
jgi:hypothetical protein